MELVEIKLHEFSTLGAGGGQCSVSPNCPFSPRGKNLRYEVWWPQGSVLTW